MVEGEPINIQELSKEEFDAAVKERWDDLKKISAEIFNELIRLGKKNNFLSNSELDADVSSRTGISVEELKKYPVYHIINGSTPDYRYCRKYMDLPSNLIESSYREILEELKKEEKE